MTEYSIKKRLFGGEIEIALNDCDEITGEGAANEAYKEGLRLQKIFNFYDEKSELSILNKKRKLKVSDELLEVIKICLEFCEISKGTYDISLGKAFMARKKGEKEPKLNCSYKDIKIKNNEIILNHSELLIDLGSAAKGYIVDKMAEIIKKEGIESGLIDGRGDIKVFGPDSFQLDIQHPRDQEMSLGRISIKEEAVATSGDYSQYNITYDKSHLINKKFISTTVIAPSLLLADILATVLCVSDEETIIRLINQNNSCALIVDKNLKMRYFNKFKRYILNE